jgi:hypothetical protein
VGDLTLPVWVGDVGPIAGLVLLIGIMIVRGWLTPKVTVNQLVERMQQVVEVHQMRADEWRATAEANQRRADQADQMSTQLLQTLETHGALLRSIQAEALRRGGTP